MDALVKSADTCALKAEESGDLTMITKSNSLKKTSKEKQKELSQLEVELEKNK